MLYTGRGLASGMSSRVPAAMIRGLFVKVDPSSPVFVKTGAGSLSLKAGAVVEVAGRAFRTTVDEAVVMPTLTAGSDYAVYVCADGTVRADASFSAPIGYTTANSRQIGGFHYGLIAAGTTIDGGSGFRSFSQLTRSGTTTSGSAMITGLSQTSDLFAGLSVAGTGVGTAAVILSIDSASQITLSVNSTASASVTLTLTNSGLAWTQAQVDAIAGINGYSLWDLLWRPSSPDPRGMALVSGLFWSDIYLLGINHITVGTSASGQTIADGSSLPKIPVIFGGDGSKTYSGFRWHVANEVLANYAKTTPTSQQFPVLSYGVQENTSCSTDPVTTQHQAGFTSLWGIEQAVGCMNTFGERGGPYSAAAWTASSSGRGTYYDAPSVGVYGGRWDYAALSGSQCEFWASTLATASNNLGARGVCRHVNLGGGL